MAMTRSMSELCFTIRQAAWGMAAVGPPDLNGNGFVDVPDLLILLANWGPC